uniref:Uncharacterized protein n=1 Tax=Trichogramma kaykai TaxID=54128 RepID=A0ABD2VV49_9HYME
MPLTPRAIRRSCFTKESLIRNGPRATARLQIARAAVAAALLCKYEGFARGSMQSHAIHVAVRAAQYHHQCKRIRLFALLHSLESEYGCFEWHTAEQQ